MKVEVPSGKRKDEDSPYILVVLFSSSSFPKVYLKAISLF
jgi:hypothetical protein